MVDMARVAFEKVLTLKQLKAKYSYVDFIPQHIRRKTQKALLVKHKLNKTFDSALDKTYSNFYCVDNNPHKVTIISYLRQLLPSVPE